MSKQATIKARITEALHLQNGLQAGEIIEYCNQCIDDLDTQYVYNTLHLCVQNGLLNKEGKRYFLANREAYANGNHKAVANIRPVPPVEKTPVLANFQQNRKSKQVMIIASPIYYEDIVRVELLHAGGTFVVPMFGGITICIGPDIPKLSPDQESYRGVRSVRLTFRNGKTEVINTNESGHVTVAPTE